MQPVPSALVSWMLVSLMHLYGIRMDPVTLMTPNPSSDLDLISCIQAVSDGSQADREMTLMAKDGSMTSQTIDVTASSTSCVSLPTRSFRFELDANSENVHLRILTSAGPAHDAYLPLPTSCLGFEYMVSTWYPGNSFMVVFNPNDDVITTHVTLGHGLPAMTTEVDGVSLTFTPGTPVSMQIDPFQASYVTSSSSALDGLVVSSQVRFAVYAGNVDTAIFHLGLTNHFLEMLPPINFFQARYLVAISQHKAYAMLKVIALNPDTTVTTTVYDDSTTLVTSRSMTNAGETWTISQRNDQLVESDRPVMVVQFSPDLSISSSSSMVVVPPQSEWTSSVLVSPLMDSSGLGVHTCQVIALTNEIGNITAVSLLNNVDVTSSISFAPIGQSGFSKSEIVLSMYDVIQIESTSNTPFQVIQSYSGSGSDVRAYSMRAGLHSTCLQEFTEQGNESVSTANGSISCNESTLTCDESGTSGTTTATDDHGRKKLRLYPFSDTFVYLTVGVICLALVLTPLCLASHLASRQRLAQAELLPGVDSSSSKACSRVTVETLVYSKARWASPRS